MVRDLPALPRVLRNEIPGERSHLVHAAIVTVQTVEQAALDAGLNPDQARAVAADYGDAQLDALRLSLGAVALAAVLALPFTRRLPTTSLAETGVGAAEAKAIA